MVDISQASAIHYDTRFPTGIERVLNNNRMFYPEGEWGSRGGDGPDRLFVIDWDDRGYVYLPCGAVGWGITQDPGGTNDHEMPTIYQTPDFGPAIALSVKSGGAYYLLLSDNSDIYRYNVSSPGSPQGGKWTGGPAFEQAAKSSDGTRIALRSGRTISIYNSDALVTTGSALATFTNGFTGIATDGVNFYGAAKNSSENVVITVFAPNANGGYTATPYTMPFKSDAGDNVQLYMSSESGGYLTVSAAERAYGGAINIRLLKIANGVPTENPLNGYVALYYGTNVQPAGYTYPDYSRVYGAQVIKRGNKYYFVVSANSLGDVYEIRGSDSITASLKKAGRTPNGNSQAPPNSGPFYGDEITFTSAFEGQVAPSVTWDFGDGVQTTVTPGTAGAPDIAHQYGGLTAGNLPALRTVKITNAADQSMSDSINVTLAKPTALVGVLGTSLLFTGAVNDFSLPIVSSDNFFDGSDGYLEGHYSEWRLTSDTASTKSLPNQLFSVGAVGERELTFTGHYGPYAGSGSALTGVGGDAAFAVGPIHYKVRAFAPIVNGPTASGASVLFRSGTRFTTRTADLANGGATVVDYKWEMLDANNAVVGTPGTGRGAISSIADFSVLRTQFAGAQNWKARLTVTLDNNVEAGYSVPLNGPTPGPIAKSGCGNVGSPCSLSTPSTVQGNDPSTWTYSWSVTGPGAVLGATTPVFAPVFPVAGTYIVTVNVSNALGDANALQLSVTVGEPLCASNPTAATTAINYLGRTTRCLDLFSSCNPGEAIDFSFSVSGWTPADCDKYSWNFGDNTSASTAKNPSHTYAAAGTYTVTLFIDGGLADATVTRQIKIGTVTNILCPSMVAGVNVSAGYTGQTSQCTPLSGTCAAGETIAFKISTLGYSFSCGAHSISWDFGDGTVPFTTNDGTQTVNHTYANAGTYPLKLTISNPNPQTVDIARDMSIGDRIGTGCADMQPGLNLSVSFNGPTSGCTAVSGNCAANENIAFTLSTLGYSLSCAQHAYEWDFGDGSAKSTAAAPTHAYAQGGPYTVTLKLSRGGQTATLTRAVNVAVVNDCPTMVAGQNIRVVYAGEKPACTLGGNCSEKESISFGILGGYPFSCSAHTFEWDFGDGSAKSAAQSPTHAYEKGGEYAITLKIKNSKQELTVTEKVKVLTPTRPRAVRH